MERTNWSAKRDGKSRRMTPLSPFGDSQSCSGPWFLKSAAKVAMTTGPVAILPIVRATSPLNQLDQTTTVSVSCFTQDTDHAGVDPGVKVKALLRKVTSLCSATVVYLPQNDMGSRLNFGKVTGAACTSATGILQSLTVHDRHLSSNWAAHTLTR